MRIPKQIKAIILDIDGTLIDSEDGLWWVLFQGILKELNMQPQKKSTFLTHAGEFSRHLTRSLSGKAKKEAMGKIREYIHKNYMKHINKVSIFSDTIPTLKGLKKKGLTLATVTNTPRNLSFPTVQKFGLPKYFKTMVFRYDVKKIKPAPDMLLLALKRLNLKASQVIYIGDKHTDKIAARAAGIYFIGLKTAGNKRIERLNQIVKMV